MKNIKNAPVNNMDKIFRPRSFRFRYCLVHNHLDLADPNLNNFFSTFFGTRSFRFGYMIVWIWLHDRLIWLNDFFQDSLVHNRHYKNHTSG